MKVWRITPLILIFATFVVALVIGIMMKRECDHPETPATWLLIFGGVGVGLYCCLFTQMLSKP